MPPDADWWDQKHPDEPKILPEARADVRHLRFEMQRMVDQLNEGLTAATGTT